MERTKSPDVARLRLIKGPDAVCRCPPCRQFTPRLKQTYEAINATGKRLEIVFVSSDHDEKQFEVPALPLIF